jgi:hypothetical protein
VSDPIPPHRASSLADPAKALLLCQHALELSRHCLIAVHNGATVRLLDLQGRKHTIVEELAAILRVLEMDKFQDLSRLVDDLRGSLRAETKAMVAASSDLQNEFLTVGTAQRRLANARRYDTASPSVPRKSGGKFSVSG